MPKAFSKPIRRKSLYVNMNIYVQGTMYGSYVPCAVDTCNGISNTSKRITISHTRMEIIQDVCTAFMKI